MKYYLISYYVSIHNNGGFGFEHDYVKSDLLDIKKVCEDVKKTGHKVTLETGNTTDYCCGGVNK